MLKRISDWWERAKQQNERARSIEFIIKIPYTSANERALRHKIVHTTVAQLEAGVAERLPGLDNFKIKCISNPNWRK